MSGGPDSRRDAWDSALAQELPCQELTPGEARHLLALHDLTRAGERLTQAAIARRLDVSAPTVLEMLRRLRALDLVEPDALALTARGTSAALVLAARRRAAEVLARDILGIDDARARAEAERLTASLSPLMARRLVAWSTHHKG
jgi:Mn-dependent DtxR family transcriptional regulator